MLFGHLITHSWYFFVLLKLHNVSNSRLKSDSLVFRFMTIIRIALQNCNVGDSKSLIFVAFKTVMSIIIGSMTPTRRENGILVYSLYTWRE